MDAYRVDITQFIKKSEMDDDGSEWGENRFTEYHSTIQGVSKLVARMKDEPNYRRVTKIEITAIFIQVESGK